MPQYYVSEKKKKSMGLHQHKYTKAQIDYAFISKKWKYSGLNCEAYSYFEGVSSDHPIVTAKIRLSLRRNAARTTTIVHYNRSQLKNRDLQINMC